MEGIQSGKAEGKRSEVPEAAEGVLGPQVTYPWVRSLSGGQQVRRTQGISFPGVDGISLQLLAVLGLHQTRHNCTHFGDCMGVPGLPSMAGIRA